MEALRKKIESLKGSTAYLYDAGKDDSYGGTRARTVDALLTLLKEAEEEMEVERGRTDAANLLYESMANNYTTMREKVRGWADEIEEECDPYSASSHWIKKTLKRMREAAGGDK